MERIDNLYYRFKGINQSLYCVGDFNIADELNKLINIYKLAYGDSIIILPQLRNDFEWMKTSDSFLDDVYNKIINNLRVDTSYIYENRNKQIQPVNITLAKHYERKQFTATYIRDLNVDPVAILISKGISINAAWKNLPLALLITDDHILHLTYHLAPIEKRYINQDVRFEGTYSNPVIVVDNQIIDPILVRTIIT